MLHRTKLCEMCKGQIRLKLSDKGMYECHLPIKCQHRGLCIEMALNDHGVKQQMNGATISPQKT